MMPDIEREERRKKRVPVIAFILSGTLVVSLLLQLFQPGWQGGARPAAPGIRPPERDPLLPWSGGGRG